MTSQSLNAWIERRAVPSTGQEYELLVGECDGVELHASIDSRRIFWASDWTRIWTLPLERVHGGPDTYGHTDFYFPTSA